MSTEPAHLTYTIKLITGGEGNPPLVRLDSLGWLHELGIQHIQFTSQRGAAYFAQHHAAGRPATLRLYHDGQYCGDRPIPPAGEIPVPAAHESMEGDFFQFFLSWPLHPAAGIRLKCKPTMDPPQQRSSKVKDHPAAWRWTPPDPLSKQ